MASYTRAASLLSRSISRPTLYTLRFPGSKVSRGAQRYLDMFCSSTAIPEVRMETVAVPGHENMGIVRDQPIQMVFGKPFKITVIEDSDFSNYREFRNWLDGTTVNANQQPGTPGGRNQRQQYYNTYTHDIQLIKLEQAGGIANPFDRDEDLVGYREVMRVNFINAYPINMGQISLNSDAENTFTTFDVNFSYESYSVAYDGLDFRGVASNIARFF